MGFVFFLLFENQANFHIYQVAVLWPFVQALTSFGLVFYSLGINALPAQMLLYSSNWFIGFLILVQALKHSGKRLPTVPWHINISAQKCSKSGIKVFETRNQKSKPVREIFMIPISLQRLSWNTKESTKLSFLRFTFLHFKTLCLGCGERTMQSCNAANSTQFHHFLLSLDLTPPISDSSFTAIGWVLSWWFLLFFHLLEKHVPP